MKLPDLSLPAIRERIPAIAIIAAVQLWLGLLWFVYWGHGLARAAIILCLLAGLLIGRTRLPKIARANGKTKAPLWLIAFVVAAVLLNCVLMAVTGLRTWRTGRIPMDEGQTSWRAARLLVKGEDPYATGALVDLVAYRKRIGNRREAGMGPSPPRPALEAALKSYDGSLDSKLRRTLLPVSPQANAQQLQESRLTGYKYGPLIVLFTAALEPIGTPAIVLWLNGLFAFALYGVLWRILDFLGRGDRVLSLVAFLALLLDRHITRNYINRSATDIYGLFFCAVAVLAWLRNRPASTAIAIACSIGCKILPGLGFVPLLLRFRSAKPLLIFAAVLTVIYLPWLIWDGAGLIYNVGLWPVLMDSRSNSWQHYASPESVFFCRAILAALLVWVWARFLTGRNPSLLWALAVSNTVLLLAGGNFSNNYVPWASIWIVLWIVEAARSGDSAAPCSAPEADLEPKAITAAA